MFSNPTNIPRSNLSYEYELNGNGNDTAGSSNLTTTNFTWLKSKRGYVGEVAYLNGSSSYATASHSFSGNFTIGQWVKWDSFNAGGESQIYRVTGAGSTNIGINHYDGSGSNKFQLYTHDGTNGSSIFSTVTPQIGKWYFIIARGNGVNRDIIVYDEDHNRYITSTTVAPSVTLSGTADIGRHPTVSGRELHGELGLMRFSTNYAMTDKELENLFIEGIKHLGSSILQQYPELFEGCVGYYDFRGDASNLIDGKKATVNGATLTTDHLGNSNSAYLFDALTEYISGGDIGLQTGDKTIHILVKPSVSSNLTDNIFGFQSSDSSGNANAIFAYSHSQSAFQQSWYIKNTTGTYYNAKYTTPLVADTLYLLSLVIDGTNMKAYLNGDLETTTAFSGTLGLPINTTFGTEGGTSMLGDNILGILNNGVQTAEEIKLLSDILLKKYIYPFAKYTPQSIPKPLVHIDGTNNGTTWYDQSGNGHNATGSNTSVIRINQSKGIDYNGSSTKLTIPHHTDFNFTDQFTIMFPFIVDVVEAGKGIIGKWSEQPSGGTNQFAFLTNSDGTVEMHLVTSAQTSVKSNTILTAGKIYNIAFKYDGVNMYLFINGKLDNIVAKTGNMTLSGTLNRIEIGTYSSGILDQYLNGKIFPLKIWDSALTDKQLEEESYGTYI